MAYSYYTQVQYACGHLGNARVHNRGGREWAKSSAGELLCQECEQLDGRLPQLVGSPKQVAWARKIRARFVAVLAELAPRYEGEWWEMGADWAILAFQRACEAIGARDSAKWWIDNRRRSAWALAIEAEPTLDRFTKPAPRIRDVPPPAPPV